MDAGGGRRQDEPEANAIRWLRRAYRLGAIVDGLATVGMIFPGRLWTAGFRAPFDRNRPELAYEMRAAAIRQTSAEGVVASSLETANAPPGRKGSSS